MVMTMKIRIGLETHVQLNTKSKIFCGCRNPANLKEEPEPNTLTCPTCLGMPGSKPRMNKAVLDSVLRLAIALNCKVEKETFFSRKTYFYPDMSKNFQITQYDVPLAKDGYITINVDGKMKRISIRRAHMEEDPAKLVHVGGLGGKHTLVDYNRSGIPLVEIVTEPDFSSPEEARMFLQKLEGILEYLGLYDPLSRAVFKSDANVSLDGGARIEVKNITGTKETEQALKYEIVRQGNLLKRGIQIRRETRAWNPDTGSTQTLRGKEEEEEYGYIFEPDLTVIGISNAQIENAKRSLPELPDEKKIRYIKNFRISDKLAEALVSEPDIAQFFETVAAKADPKLAASWIAGPLKKTLNWNSLRLGRSGMRPEWFMELMQIFGKGKITDLNAEMAMRKMVEEKRPPEEIIRKYGFAKSEEISEIGNIIKKVIKNNNQAVTDYKSGEQKALFFLIGQVMKESKGTIDPNEARRLLEKALK